MPKHLQCIRAWLAQGRRHWLALAALLVVVAAVHLYALMRTPPPFVDEAWNASRARGLIQTGRQYGMLDAGVFERFDGYWTYFLWLGTAIHAVAIHLLGLSLASLRLTSLAFGLLLLVAVYAIGRRLGGARLGLLAAALTSLSQAFFQSAHLGRHDVVIAAMGFGAVALCLWDDARGFSARSVLAGLLVGLTLDVHPNGAIFGPAILALYLYESRWRVWRCRRCWGFCLGAAAGLAFFLALHVLPYPQTYSTIASLAISGTRTPPLLTWDLRVWADSLVQAALLVCWAGGYYGPLAIAAAAALALRRHSQGETKIVLLLLALTLAAAAWIGNKATYYAIILSPAADLALAVFLIRLWREGVRGVQRRRWPATVAYGALVLVVCTLLITAVIGDVQIMQDRPLDEYQAAVARIAEVVPPGSSLMAAQTYWLDLPGRPYWSWEQMAYYQRAVPGSTWQDALRALHPDYLVVDRHIEGMVVDDKANLPSYYSYSAVLRPEFERFLAQQAHLATAFETKAFGQISIYRIDGR